MESYPSGDVYACKNIKPQCYIFPSLSYLARIGFEMADAGLDSYSLRVQSPHFHMADSIQSSNVNGFFGQTVAVSVKSGPYRTAAGFEIWISTPVWCELPRMVEWK